MILQLKLCFLKSLWHTCRVILSTVLLSSSICLGDMAIAVYNGCTVAECYRFSRFAIAGGSLILKLSDFISHVLPMDWTKGPRERCLSNHAVVETAGACEKIWIERNIQRPP